MVYLTGDTHAIFSRFKPFIFRESETMTKDDVVIILGDFGGVWYDCPEERDKLNWLNAQPFTTCYVDGNHECFDRYYTDEFPVVDFHGGKAHQIRDSIFHLMRGNVFDFEGKKFFAMGGARSHDISDGILDETDFDNPFEFEETVYRWRLEGRMFRIKGLSWWEQEIPSQEEFDFAEKTLKENNYEVDYVISHCLPQDVASAVGFTESDKLTTWFNKILLEDKLKFHRWYCGHYHMDTTVMGKFHIMCDRIERIL